MLDATVRNRRLKELLIAAENEIPGIRAHAERVSVYSVAIGGRLRLSKRSLVALQIAAELHDLSDKIADMRILASEDDLSRGIVGLSEAFDCRRSGFHGQPRLSDEDAVSWLKNDASSEFEARIVEALLSVQSVIQPVEH